MPDPRSMTLHGHRLSYTDTCPNLDARPGRATGPRPAATILFVHGLMSSSATWADQTRTAGDGHRVIAPDLFGHGASAKPPGDYSLGAHAATLRDLMDALEVPSATVVGHSLGGGIALQFAYLFPDRVDGAGAGQQRRPRSRVQPAAAGGHPARAASSCCRWSPRAGCTASATPHCATGRSSGCRRSVPVRTRRGGICPAWRTGDAAGLPGDQPVGHRCPRADRHRPQTGCRHRVPGPAC